jgi:hypothetical protein
VNPDSDSNTLENESSDEEIVTEKISWAEGAERVLHFWSSLKDGHVTTYTLLLSTLQRKRKEFIRIPPPDFPERATRISSRIQNSSDEAEWSVSIRGESSSIGM